MYNVKYADIFLGRIFFVCRRYSRVREWTVGLSGGKDLIAVLRASGRIICARGPFNIPSSSIIGEQFIEKISMVRGMLFSYQVHKIFIIMSALRRLSSVLLWVQCTATDMFSSTILYTAFHMNITDSLLHCLPLSFITSMDLQHIVGTSMDGKVFPSSMELFTTLASIFVWYTVQAVECS